MSRSANNETERRISAGDTAARATTESGTGHRLRESRYGYLAATVDDLGSPMTIDRLVDAMCAWESASTTGDASKSWHDVHQELHSVDLPTLDRAGLVEFDAAEGIVRSARE
jgi:hypothetical protein